MSSAKFEPKAHSCWTWTCVDAYKDHYPATLCRESAYKDQALGQGVPVVRLGCKFDTTGFVANE